MAYTQARVNAALDGANNGIAWAVLHDGDPGGAGTGNQAAESSPVAASFPNASNGEAKAQVTFTISGAGGPYTHVSLWSDSGGSPGTFYGSAALTPEESFNGAGTLEVTITTTANST